MIDVSTAKPPPAHRGRYDYHQWMQEIRRFKTLYRVPAYGRGHRFYRTCVIDAVLEHSPAAYMASGT
jgi:integrase/recombinase XerD